MKIIITIFALINIALGAGKNMDKKIMIKEESIGIGDHFELNKGDSIDIATKDKTLSIELTEQSDDGHKITMTFTYKTTKLKGSGDIILNYTQELIDWKDIPEGKTPLPNDKIYSSVGSQPELIFGQYKLIIIKTFDVLNFGTNLLKVVDQK